MRWIRLGPGDQSTFSIHRISSFPTDLGSAKGKVIDILGQKRKVPILAISYMLNTGTKDSVSDGGEAKVELGHRLVSACVYN